MIYVSQCGTDSTKGSTSQSYWSQDSTEELKINRPLVRYKQVCIYIDPTEPSTKSSTFKLLCVNVDKAIHEWPKYSKTIISLFLNHMILIDASDPASSSFFIFPVKSDFKGVVDYPTRVDAGIITIHPDKPK